MHNRIIPIENLFSTLTRCGLGSRISSQWDSIGKKQERMLNLEWVIEISRLETLLSRKL